MASVCVAQRSKTCGVHGRAKHWLLSTALRRAHIHNHTVPRKRYVTYTAPTSPCWELPRVGVAVVAVAAFADAAAGVLVPVAVAASERRVWRYNTYAPTAAMPTPAAMASFLLVHADDMVTTQVCAARTHAIQIGA